MSITDRARAFAPIRFTIIGEPAITDRFMQKVSQDAATGCWLWSGAPSDSTPTGQYGRFRVHGVQIRAHRVAWMLFRGDIPEGKHVLHRCDNPRCVCPEHLFIGTNDDNVADRVSKGRSGFQERRGTDHPMHRLTEGDVVAIRNRYSNGERGKDLAAEFGVHRATISEIVNRRKWRHVA